MILTLNLAINNLSFGQTSSLILRTLFDMIRAGNDFDVRVFPIGGGYDLSAQKPDKEFEQWLNTCIHKAHTLHNRSNPVFKLWHLMGSMESFSEKQTLLSFYELDSPTPVELNVARNNKTIFTSNYTREVFGNAGVDTEFVALAFDSYNFSQTNKKYFADGRIVFNLPGKVELRKGHAQVIKAWIKKYGGNRNYALQCATYNPFLNEQQNNQFIVQNILEGKSKPFNVSFLPMMPQNEMYNDYLNSGDIVIGMGNESWGLPEFQSVAIGKHAVVLDYNGHKGWATPENSVLVNPNGKKEAYDGVFFHKGQPFNQGNNPTFSDDAFIEGCEKAISRVKASKLNIVGLDLQKQFCKENFVSQIIKTYDA